MPEITDDKLARVYHDYGDLQRALFKLALLVGISGELDPPPDNFITDYLAQAGEMVKQAHALRESVIASLEEL